MVKIESIEKKYLAVTLDADGKVVTLGNADDVGEVYRIPLDLYSVTVEQAQTLYDVFWRTAPEEYIKAISGFIEMPDEQRWSSAIEEQTAALIKAVCSITGIPEAAFDGMSMPRKRELVNAFELGVVLPLYNVNFIKPEDGTAFEFDGVEYDNISVAVDFVTKQMVANPDMTTEEWCEANDIAAATQNSVSQLHLLTAILCRPKGEVYDEAKVRQRAQLFLRLPVKIALDAFFRLATLAVTSLGTMMSSLVDKVKANEMKAADAERARRR